MNIKRRNYMTFNGVPVLRKANNEQKNKAQSFHIAKAENKSRASRNEIGAKIKYV
jgi:hypothetical protein